MEKKAGNEEFTVTVTRVSSADVRVRAGSALHAAKLVDDTGFPLPPDDAWDHRDYEYAVYAADGTELYYGDAQELS